MTVVTQDKCLLSTLCAPGPVVRAQAPPTHPTTYKVHSVIDSHTDGKQSSAEVEAPAQDAPGVRLCLSATTAVMLRKDCPYQGLMATRLTQAAVLPDLAKSRPSPGVFALGSRPFASRAGHWSPRSPSRSHGPHSGSSPHLTALYVLPAMVASARAAPRPRPRPRWTARGHPLCPQ